MTLLEQTPAIFIEDTVRTPDGKIGTVASQCYIDPNDGLETCLVDVRGMNSIAYNTADLEVVDDELTSEDVAALDAALSEPDMEPMTSDQLAAMLGITDAEQVQTQEFCIYCDTEFPKAELVCIDVAYDEQNQEVALYSCEACSPVVWRHAKQAERK